MEDRAGTWQHGNETGQPDRPEGWWPHEQGPVHRQRRRAGRSSRPPRHRPNWWMRRPGGGGPLRRSQSGRVAGGVAAGISARTGLNVTLVRVVFVLATLAGAFGAALYVLGWLLIPATGESSSIGSRALGDRRGIAQAAGIVSMLGLLLLIASAFGATWLSSLAWPLVICVAGIALIWRNAPPEEQAVIRRVAEPLAGLTGNASRTRIVVRFSLVVVLAVSGLVLLLSGHLARAALRPLGGVALVIAALVVVLAPWWLKIVRDLMAERQARARAEERADMASRIHDSVLQTLALIQLKADTPQQVIQLARAQERELRSWLFDGRAPGSLDQEAVTLAAGVRLIQQDVEAQHGVAVEAVTVGDCGLDDDLAALLAAAREATVNAVKWSGAAVVSVFAEVEPAEVSLFVRDRGRGFDPAAVPPDRKGVAESIRARMARHGGVADIRTVMGEGTEVTLRMPRGAGKRGTQHERGIRP